MKKTFLSKEINYASEIALKNIIDLEMVIDWNIKNHLLFYRMSSDMFPWMSEYEICDLPDIGAIKTILARIGEKAKHHKLRLTYHPGRFNVLATKSDGVLKKTQKELRQHGEIMDLIGLPRTTFAKINIHVGGAYGDKPSALQRFATHYHSLPDTAKSRITVENDDKANMFSVKDLMELHEMTGIPIVFDYLHHQFCTGGWSEQEALIKATQTWPKGIMPVVHFSSSRKKFEDDGAGAASHADFIYQPIGQYGIEADIMLEAKAKELAVFKYSNEYY